MAPRTRRLAAYGAALLALGAVFSLYLRPDFMVDLSNMLWACFGS